MTGKELFERAESSDADNIINEYCNKTGQTRQYLFSGGFSYGWTFIIDELVPKALKENKKIVWKVDYTAFDKMSYSLQKIKPDEIQHRGNK
jgi:hypothetical protein